MSGRMLPRRLGTRQGLEGNVEVMMIDAVDSIEVAVEEDDTMTFVDNQGMQSWRLTRETKPHLPVPSHGVDHGGNVGHVWKWTTGWKLGRGLPCDG